MDLAVYTKMLMVVLMPRERVPGTRSLTCTVALTKTSSVTSFASTMSLIAPAKRSSLQTGSKVSMPMIRAELTSLR